MSLESDKTLERNASDGNLECRPQSKLNLWKRKKCKKNCLRKFWNKSHTCSVTSICWALTTSLTCYKVVSKIIFLNSHNDTRWVMQNSFYNGSKWGLKTFSNSPMVTQAVKVKVVSEPRSAWPQSLALNYHFSLPPLSILWVQWAYWVRRPGLAPSSALTLGVFKHSGLLFPHPTASCPPVPISDSTSLAHNPVLLLLRFPIL